MSYLIFTSIVAICVFIILFSVKRIFEVIKIDLKIISITVFISFLLIGFLGTFISNKKSSEIENRSLAKWIPLKDQKFTEWSGSIETFANDHFGLRSWIIEFYKNIQIVLFNSSPTEKVIMGRQGWLFSAATVNSSFLDETHNIDFSESNLINKLEELDQYLKERDIELLIVVIPSKPYVYSNYLPRWIVEKKSNRSSINSFVSFIQNKTDIDLIDLYDFFINSKKEYDQRLYYKSDTHWSPSGALFAIEYIFSYLKLNYGKNIQLSTFTLRENKFIGNLYRLIGKSEHEFSMHYLPNEKHSRRSIVINSQIRELVRFEEEIEDWKKLAVHYSLNEETVNSDIIPIVIGDSFMLRSSGTIFMDQFAKSYTMHYQEMAKGLPVLLQNEKDANLLILEFADYKFLDGQYNSFIENCLNWNSNYIAPELDTLW